MLSFLGRSRFWAALSLLSFFLLIVPSPSQAQDSSAPIDSSVSIPVPSPPVDASDSGGTVGSDGLSQAGVDSPGGLGAQSQLGAGGYYQQTSQTGGTKTEDPFYVGNYSTAGYWSNSSVPTYGAYGFAGPSGANTGYATCSGQITTTFTWIPAYPGQSPPLKVVTEERCEASYYGYSGAWNLNIPAPGTADDGLGDPVIPGDALSGNSHGTRYKVVRGTQTITITCSPSATVTSATFGQAWVYYSASVFPIVLEVWGTTPDANGTATALIGQSLHSDLTIVGDGVAGHPFKPITFSNYNWAISGAVKGFYGDTQTNPHHGHIAYLSDTDRHSPSPKWYGTQGSPFGRPETIYCRAQVNAGNTSIGSAIGLMHVNMFAPFVTTTNTPEGVQIVSQGTPDASLNTDIAWTASVSMPYPFGSDLGYFYYTQLCSLNRDLASVVPFGKDITVNTGGYVLDNEVVYSTIDVPPNGTWWADSKVENSGDTPSIGLDLKALVTQQDAWKTFLMFVPPGNDVMAVPVHELDWKVDANAHLILNGGGQWLPKPPGTITVTGDQSFLGSFGGSAPAVNWPAWDDVYITTPSGIPP